MGRRRDAPMEVDLVRVEPDEIRDAVAVLEAAGLPTADVDDRGVHLFRVERGGRTIGIGGLERYDEAALLRSIVVAEDARGQGVGTAICRGLEREARRRGAERAYLLTTDAAGFFERIGYERCGREDVPGRIARSRQFTELCPSSATCLRKSLTDRPGD